MVVSIIEGPAEKVKRYLIQALKTAYGSAVVSEVEIAPGTFTAPTFKVRMEPDRYDANGWAISRAVVTSRLRTLAADAQHEDANDLAYDVIRMLTLAVRQRGPVISSVRAPWLKLTPVSVTKGRPRDLSIQGAEFIEINWTLDYQTGIKAGRY